MNIIRHRQGVVEAELFQRQICPCVKELSVEGNRLVAVQRVHIAAQVPREIHDSLFGGGILPAEVLDGGEGIENKVRLNLAEHDLHLQLFVFTLLCHQRFGGFIQREQVHHQCADCSSEGPEVDSVKNKMQHKGDTRRYAEGNERKERIARQPFSKANQSIDGNTEGQPPRKQQYENAVAVNGSVAGKHLKVIAHNVISHQHRKLQEEQRRCHPAQNPYFPCFSLGVNVVKNPPQHHRRQEEAPDSLVEIGEVQHKMGECALLFPEHDTRQNGRGVIEQTDVEGNVEKFNLFPFF